MSASDTVIRPDRTREEHAGRTSAMNRAILLAVACFLGAGVAFFSMMWAGVEQGGLVWQRASLAAVVVVGGSILFAVWTYVRTIIYRCPRCGGRTVTVDEAYPAIHKYCGTCNVEWVTGVEHSLD